MNEVFESALREALHHSEDDPIRDCEGVNFDDLKSKCDEYFGLANNNLHIFPFKAVRPCWFRLYTDTSIIKAIQLLQQQCPAQSIPIANPNITPPPWYDEFVSLLDMALIMAGGSHREQLIHSLLSDFKANFLTRKRHLEEETELPCDEHSIPKIEYPVNRLGDTSLMTFHRYMHETREPAILSGIQTDWPAAHNWKSVDYWSELTLQGRRLVPIELGRSYVDDDWGQKIMPFGQFLHKHILNHTQSNQTGYLAQHDLLSQIPSLRADITIPDYCYLDTPQPEPSTEPILEPEKPQSEALAQARTTAIPNHPSPTEDTNFNPAADDNSTQIHTNIWFGPAWTITPLHHDPYHNILTQIHGKKYIRLYSPHHSAKLSPLSRTHPAPHLSSTSDSPGLSTDAPATIDMSNTSSIDIADIQISPDEDWDEVYPGFSGLEYVEVVLGPGEALYIPRGWWHFVRSCSVGISVSFWWN